MKVNLNESACQGHGRCYELAPDVFLDDERGRGELLLPEVSGSLALAAGEAARACPEHAITVEN